MKKNTHKREATPANTGSRYSDLKRMLEDRRRELQAEVQGKMRGVREEGSWGGKLNEVLDTVESAEADIQEEIEFALVQMKSETLSKVNDALVRLEQGNYGNCFDCGEEIAEKRLRALPFAVRCKDCEEARETAEQRERQLTARRGTSSLFLDMYESGVPTIRGSAGGGASFPPHRPTPTLELRIVDCGLRTRLRINVNPQSIPQSAIRNPQ